MGKSAKENKAREVEMVMLLRKRDRQAITELYNSYSAALYHIIHRIVRSEEIGREVLQDSFLKIWENADKYDSQKGRLFTWMARISRNLAIDRIRSSQFKKGNKTDELPDYVSNDGRLSEQQPERDFGLKRVVANLEEKNRIIIDLLYFNDYTQSEVSEELGIPLGTVKSRARKAISLLREVLENEGMMVFIFFLFSNF